MPQPPLIAAKQQELEEIVSTLKTLDKRSEADFNLPTLNYEGNGLKVKFIQSDAEDKRLIAHLRKDVTEHGVAVRKQMTAKRAIIRKIATLKRQMNKLAVKQPMSFINSVGYKRCRTKGCSRPVGKTRDCRGEDCTGFCGQCYK